MEWTNQLTLEFLELYRDQPAIWNPKSQEHKMRNQVIDAWTRIQDSMGVYFTVSELKKKKDSLMATYRSLKNKVKSLERSGSEAYDSYQPIWFAYSLMDSFLSQIYDDNSDSQHIETANTPIRKNESFTSKQHTRNCITNGRSETHTFNNNHNSENKLLKHRLQSPPELKAAKRQMDEAFNILKNINSSFMKNNNQEDDECGLYGRLLASKLRKMSENKREILMHEIDNLIFQSRNLDTMKHYTETASPCNSVSASPAQEIPDHEYILSSSEPQESQTQLSDNETDLCNVEIKINSR